MVMTHSSWTQLRKIGASTPQFESKIVLFLNIITQFKMDTENKEHKCTYKLNKR